MNAIRQMLVHGLNQNATAEQIGNWWQGLQEQERMGSGIDELVRDATGNGAETLMNLLKTPAGNWVDLDQVWEMGTDMTTRAGLIGALINGGGRPVRTSHTKTGVKKLFRDWLKAGNYVDDDGLEPFVEHVLSIMSADVRGLIHEMEHELMEIAQNPRNITNKMIENVYLSQGLNPRSNPHLPGWVAKKLGVPGNEKVMKHVRKLLKRDTKGAKKGKGKPITMPLGAFKREHKNLVHVLERGTPAQRSKEAQEQRAELKARGGSAPWRYAHKAPAFFNVT